MQYFSTRNKNERVTAAQAVARGLATDGGLYVPESFPKLAAEDIAQLCPLGYRERAERIIAGFLPEFSAQELRSMLAAAYGEKYDDEAIAPTRLLDGSTGFLELWHGPTCAFKDMALQLLPHLLTASLKKCGEERSVCILVATSGDTGKAALDGFADVEGTRILVFYPRDGVSDVQRLQMQTQAGENVRVCAVEGNFDDTQSGVKLIFGDEALAQELTESGWYLSSANSINWGRLLPQIIYYFSAYCDFVNAGVIKAGEEMIFSVPTGNFGDILAGWFAKQMGLPVRRFICASNANNVLTDFINTGVYDRNRPFYTTISPSMDILISSNLERLLYCLCEDDAQVAAYMEALKSTGRYEVSEKLKAAVTRDFYAGYCDDEVTKAAIAALWNEKGYLMDPHTAVAYKVLGDYRAKTGDGTPAAVVSTASPYKFCDSVLSALGEQSEAPGTALLERLSEKTGTPIPAPLAALAGKAPRFKGCVAKEGMKGAVQDFLK